MKTIYLIAFGGGLVIAVYAMLSGVEKEREAGVTRPAAYLNLPALAAFMVVLGAVGYLLLQNSKFSTPGISLFAVLGGALGWIGMSTLMAKWALQPNARHAHDEAEKIQGQPAVVVRPISPGSAGSIRYGHAHAMREVAAQSLDGFPLEGGTEVVIDRFENGIAIVETWAAVEKRL